MAHYIFTRFFAVVMVLVALPALSSEAKGHDSDPDLMNYYLSPKPEKLAGWVKSAAMKPTSQGHDDSHPAFFFGEALRRNPEQCASIKALILETDADEIKRLGILSLWLADVKASREALTTVSKQLNGTEYIDMVDSLLQQQAPKAIRIPIVEAADIDRLWMVFFASGDTRAVRRIMSIGRYDPERIVNKVSMDNFILIKTARWSLFSISKDHASVNEAMQKGQMLRLPGDFGSPDGLLH